MLDAYTRRLDKESTIPNVIEVYYDSPLGNGLEFF